MPFEMQLKHKLMLVAVAAIVVVAYYLLSPTGALSKRYIFTGEGNSTYSYSISSSLDPMVSGEISHNWTSETVDGVAYDVNEQYGRITRRSTYGLVNYFSHRWIYLSRPDRACAFKKVESSSDANGYVISDESYVANCSENEMYPDFSYFRRYVPDLKRSGTEELNLPAGKFRAAMYHDNSTQATYWDGGLPFPVKIQYDWGETYVLSEYRILPAR
ncbi:Uncharacterised protein [uncultured archaeon]|nr:Uncharacterised protein [uncultured archaeon]